MTSNIINIAQSVTIPLSEKAHQWAQKFATAQLSADKAKQVYLNTLAVYGVHTYLQWLQIETDLENSDSGNLGANAFFDVCDLELPNIGKIICCPVLPKADSFTTPEIILPDAVAYIPCRFGQVLNEVELLGYRPIINTVPKFYLDYCDADSLAENRDDGSSIFPIENLLSWLFMIEDIRELLDNDNEEFSVVAGMRKLLKQQNISSSQFAVKSINISQNGLPAKQLIGTSSGNMATFLKSTSDLSTSEEQVDRELEEIAGQWLELVKGIINKSI
jgi:hypothetical protein